jgi:hypothetical protein
VDLSHDVIRRNSSCPDEVRQGLHAQLSHMTSMDLDCDLTQPEFFRHHDEAPSLRQKAGFG